MAQASPTELDQLVSAFPEPVRDLALRARELIVSVLPGIEEVVDSKARVVGYGFGSGYRNLACTLILSRNEVKLGIVDGAVLPDEHRLLRGAGKRHRHVPLRTANDLRQAGLVELLQATAARVRGR